ncbi:hypothetical protein JCM10450v2_001276 [Rhodotorula kratochvilovae]
MPPFGRPSVIHLTPDTPSPVTYEHGLSPKHTLKVHDLDGQGKEWRVDATGSKVSIYNSKNLTLRLPGRIVTSMVEVWSSSNITLVVGPASPSSSDEPSPLGMLQLDPELHNVSIRYTSPSSAGKIVVSPLLTEDASGLRSFGFEQVTLQAGDDAPFVLVDTEGSFHEPQEPRTVISPANPPQELARQLVVSYANGAWRLDGLARGEKDYPVLS